MSEATPTTFKLRAFAAWIEAKGGTVETVRGEYEVLRYRLDSPIPRILYRNKAGKLTVAPELRADYSRFLHEAGAIGEEAVSRLRRENSMPLKKKLVERDRQEGGFITCCYCGQFITLDDATLEHFHPISTGGRHHSDNCALACEGCNSSVGSLPVYHKILRRDVIRAAAAQCAPWEQFDARKAVEEPRP